MQVEIDQLLEHTPDLKSKEIAKKLGFGKSEVSAYLHGNKDRYTQNEKFQWSLVDKVFRKILFPSGWVTCDLFEQSLIEAGDVFDERCNTVRFVLPQDCNLMIDALARILSLMNQLAYHEKTIVVDFTDCYKTQSYLNRAGFFDLLHESIDVCPKRPQISAAQQYRGNSDNLVELRLVEQNSENNPLKEQLTDAFVNLSAEKFKVAAYTVFGELIGNISEHSETNIPGFAGLQKYRGSKEHIQIVISDSGIGIASSLRSTLQKHYPEIYRKYSSQTIENDAELVTEVMSSGGISRFGREDGRGLGFKSSKEQANRFNARFTVRQDRFSLKFEVEDGEIKKVSRSLNLSLLRGTHICFDFQIE